MELQDSTIPKFRADDYLPEGLYLASETEIVFRFGSSTRRRRRLTLRLRRWIELARLIGGQRLLIDGSFVTAKDEPHDIDAVILLPPDLGMSEDETEGHSSLLPQPVIGAAREALAGKNAVLHRGESLWCFFPVCSQSEVYGVACIKFAVPRFYDEADKEIFILAGAVLGAYTEIYTSRDEKPSSLLQAVLSGTDHPIVVVDRKGVVTTCNSATQTVYGHEASETIGRSFGDLVFPADSPTRYEDLLDRAMRGDVIRDEEMTHFRSDWTMVDVSVTAYPLELDGGVIAGAVFILRDLRERRHLWRKMMRWEKLSALGELLSSVANDLNNPLTSLIGYSQLMLHRRSDGEIDEMASTIYQEAKRCGDIVRGVLRLARADETRTEYLHINDVIAVSMNLKRRQLRANNVDVEMNLGEGFTGTVAGPHDMELLFLHIINYAEQRMMEYDNGGKLTVESAFEAGNIVVRFGDTGTCILEDDMAEILDPFFTSSREDGGVRPGLSISCQVLRNNGGNIRIDNQMGKGNVFTVELPAVEDESPDIAEHPQQTVAHSLEAGKRILVVDDEPAIVELLTEILRQMGHVADIAGDGNEAMKKLNTGNYDLIIADLRMPCGFTGDRLHKFIKLRNPALARRMIFITGDVTNPETEKFLQSTGNLYLKKPFPLGSLRETIQKSLTRQEFIE